jgi:hypothetical protein
MTSKAELAVSQSLRAVLAAVPAGSSIGDSEPFVAFQSALELFLPAELGWGHESFDGFRFVTARKVAPDEAEFVGLALLISDQAWTPIHLWLRLASEADQVAELDCRIGETGNGAAGLLRIPYGAERTDKFLARLPDRIDTIHWVYRATR